MLLPGCVSCGRCGGRQGRVSFADWFSMRRTPLVSYPRKQIFSALCLQGLPLIALEFWLSVFVSDGICYGYGYQIRSLKIETILKILARFQNVFQECTVDLAGYHGLD